MDFSKLLAHPNKDEIVSKLVSGVSSQDIGDWLKLKYSDKEQSHLRLSSKYLKEFLDNNIDLYEALKQDIDKVRTGQKIEKKIAESLKNNKTYQERLNDLANNELDIKKLITETVFMIRERAIQVFDKIQENPGNTKPDYALIKWFEVLLGSMEKYDKIVNKAPDQIVQHNVTMQVIDQHTAAFQDVIREVLAEIDPEASFLFMEKLKEKMEALKPPKEDKPLSQERRLKEAELISTTVMNASVVEQTEAQSE